MSSIHHEIDRLIQQHIDGNLMEPGAARLVELAEKDPAVLDEIIRQRRINAMLKDILRGGLVRASLAQTVAEVIDHRGQPLRFHFRNRPLMWSGVAVAVFLSVLLLPVLWSVILPPTPPPAANGKPLVIVKETTIIEKEKEPYFVAVLDNAFDVVWDDKLPPQNGDRLVAGEYRLQNGMAKILFASGVVVLAEGPTAFRLVSPDRIECSSGKISAVVPKNAIGFRVDLPRTSVVDLGTVFTVNVTDRHDEIQTLQGTVFAADSENRSKTIFKGGEAARFDETDRVRRYRSDFSQLTSILALSEVPRETGRDVYEDYLKKRRKIPRVLLPECFSIALKGFAEEVPDSTLDAFQKALDLGVDGCELDVFLTTDGMPFVRYPEKNVFFTSKNVVITALSSREVQTIRLRSENSGKTWSVPTLDQVLELLQAGDCTIVIEIFEEAAISKVMDRVRRFSLEDRVVFSSLYSQVVSAFKLQHPECCVGLQIAMAPSKNVPAMTEAIIEQAETCFADYIRLEYSCISSELVEQVKTAGIPIMAWTVNDEGRMRSLIEMGVDGILTNRPDRLLEVHGKIEGLHRGLNR